MDVSPDAAEMLLGDAVTAICVQEKSCPLASTAASVDIHQETVVSAPLSSTFPFNVAEVVATDDSGNVVAIGGPALIVIAKVFEAVVPAESVT